MKAWEKLYKSEVLDEAIELADKVSIKSNDGVQIVAQVEDYRVETYMQFQSPSYPSCNCPSGYSCKHEAALIYHIRNHLDEYVGTPDFDEIFNLVSPDDLKDFLKKEFRTNPELKDKFLKRFSNSCIDRHYYSDRLDTVFKKGEGRDFRYHEIHDLDLMENELYDFIFTDISNVLSAGEHDFACDLLIRIAKLLNDEVISTHDSWYNLTDRFMEQVNILSFSIYLDSEKLDELYANMDHIMSCL
nr:hypothetical protein [uncultured Methanobrevibacter sp.]